MARSFVPIQLDQVWVAIDANNIQEIVGQRDWVPVPGAPAHMPGVVGWRAHAVALLDLGRLIGVAGGVKAGESVQRMVVIQADPCTVAVPVQGVREVVEVDDNKLAALHSTKVPFATSEVELYGTPMPVMDMRAIVDALARATEEAAA